MASRGNATCWEEIKAGISRGAAGLGFGGRSGHRGRRPQMCLTVTETPETAAEE